MIASDIIRVRFLLTEFLQTKTVLYINDYTVIHIYFLTIQIVFKSHKHYIYVIHHA